MLKAPSPLLGYNNNVRHKNRMFHVPTEDSCVKHPHIITHLFMDGGRILKSVKTSYAEHVGKDKVGDIVRQMMKDQHKAMFRALRDGEFDGIVDDAGTGVGPKVARAAAEYTAGPATLRDLPPDEEAPPPLTLDIDAALETNAPFQPQAD